MREGANIGRYRVERLLGEGVYCALDETLNHRVALKVLRPDQNASEGKARLLREARAAAALIHPNAIAIYDVGEHEGAPYIAMELVTLAPSAVFNGAAESWDQRGPLRCR